VNVGVRGSLQSQQLRHVNLEMGFFTKPLK